MSRKMANGSDAQLAFDLSYFDLEKREARIAVLQNLATVCVGGYSVEVPDGEGGKIIVQQKDMATALECIRQITKEYKDAWGH